MIFERVLLWWTGIDSKNRPESVAITEVPVDGSPALIGNAFRKLGFVKRRVGAGAFRYFATKGLLSGERA